MATEKRVKKTTENLIWTNIFLLISTIMPFVIRTLIIRFWGMDYLGLNSLFSSILQVLNISELGIGSALVISMYQPMAVHDVEQVRRLLALYRRLYLILGIGILVVGCVLIPFLGFFISGEYPADINIYFVYAIYLMQSVVGYLFLAYTQALFQADQSISISYRNASFAWLLAYGLQILLICCCRSYYSYVAILPFGTLLVNVLNYASMKKHYREYIPAKFRPVDYDKAFRTDFRKRVMAMALSKVCTVLRNSIDSVILSAVFGLVMVAKYHNYVYVMTVPAMIVGGLITSVLPSLGNGVALESPENNLGVVKLTSFIVHWISTVFAAFLLCFYSPFMHVWAGQNSSLSRLTEILFVVYFYVQTISQITGLVRNSTGIWWEGRWVPIAESAVNIVLSVAGAVCWGVEGVVFATVVSIVFVNIPFENYYVYRYYFKKTPWRALGQYIKNIFIAILTVSVTYYLKSMYNASYIKSFIVWGLICVVVPNAMLFIIQGRSNEFKDVIGIIRQMIGWNRYGSENEEMRDE